MIHDISDRKLRAFPDGKPTMPGLRGVAEVYVAVRNLDEAVARYRKAFNLPAPKRDASKELGAKLARFAGTPVVLAAPTGPWLTERLEEFGEAPCAFVIASDDNARITWLAIKGMKIGIKR